VNAYPIFEILFTIWRRKIHQGRNPGLPDGAYFHSLIYRRLIRWAEVHEVKDTASYPKNANTLPLVTIKLGSFFGDHLVANHLDTQMFCIIVLHFLYLDL
jgi:hypothetical protein